jgi:hypothetical protein
MALYDQADPGNLFLCRIDDEKFKKLQARQNLNIEQFSQLASHLQALFNHCIVNLPNELAHSHMKTTECERKFICALRTGEKSCQHDQKETIPGV